MIVYTDRGSQHTSKNYQALIAKYGYISIMSRCSNPYDNAIMESFYKTLKAELIKYSKFNSPEEAKLAIFVYIEMFYNTRRIHSSLGYMSREQFKEAKT